MLRKRAAKATTTKTKKIKYATPALDKGLDILEFLAHDPTGATKSELARELNRTVSEIFRMLLCLERRVAGKRLQFKKLTGKVERSPF